MNNVEVFVPAIHPRGFAFGYTTDTQEGVYISNGLVQLAEIEDGNYYTMILAPNRPDLRETAPWRAVASSRKASTLEEDLRRDVAGALSDDGMGVGPWTAEEVTQWLGNSGRVDRAKIALTLAELHRTGDVACCKIFEFADQEQPTEIFYAAKLHGLMYTDDEEEKV